ncbi:hypothetical protein BZA77DRAFT_378153 [Pyronema omphalodes]|nr:hypothetical protein BZA77DRAFT_378153 [Pyronema omphalodes]
MFLKLCPTTIACTVKPYRVESNPDITGVGVRAATYMQSLSAVIILGFGSSDFSSTRITLSISSLALVTSCLVMMIRGQLSLPDATVAAKLFDLTVTPFFIVEPWHSRTPGLFVANALRSLVYITINLWLNLQSPCFGNKAQQNMCIKRPGIMWRGLKLFWYGLISAAWFRRMFYFIGTSNFLGAFYALISEKARNKWLEHSNERFEYEWCSALADRSFFAWLNDDTVTFSVFDWHKDRKDKFCFSQRVSLALRIARCQRAIIAIIYLIIFTTFNEISVKKNLDQSAQEWGYGQISALILTGPAVFQLFKLVKGSFKEYDGKREPVEIDEICLHARIGVHFLYFPYKAFIKKPEILAEVVLESFEELNNSKNRNRKIECQDVENSSGELLAETSERDTSRQ